MQKDTIERQFLRATISANLPFHWVEDPEVVELLFMLRTAAQKVTPSHRQLSGRLLDAEDEAVQKRVKKQLVGQYAVVASDGWKDDSRNSISGVNLSVGGK
ncbi:hypothetical protein BDQ17DRAFT_1336713, partial [Cyathus striatus]